MYELTGTVEFKSKEEKTITLKITELNDQGDK